MPIHDWSRVPCGLFHDLSIRPDPGPGLRSVSGEAAGPDGTFGRAGGLVRGVAWDSSVRPNCRVQLGPRKLAASPFVPQRGREAIRAPGSRPLWEHGAGDEAPAVDRGAAIERSESPSRPAASGSVPASRSGGRSGSRRGPAGCGTAVRTPIASARSRPRNPRNRRGPSGRLRPA